MRKLQLGAASVLSLKAEEKNLLIEAALVLPIE